MNRDYNFDIMTEIKERYATKNFSPEPLDRAELLPVIEAARYAPSCYNEQPWRFIIGHDNDTRGKLAATLAEGNAWARHAPVLILVMCIKTFKLDGSVNAYSRFDAGTASGFLQLEAIHRGFVTHCMAGFDAEEARKALQRPDNLDIVELIALGKPASEQARAEEAEQGVPGTRVPLDSLIINR
jgi:nitroreductase